jgi:hypothetical protein
MTEDKRSATPKPLKGTKTQRDVWFAWSASLFRMGLAFVTFEQVRPGGIMVSDYCFLLSLLLIPKSYLLKVKGSGILLAGSMISVGALLSLHGTGSWAEATASLGRLFLLFGLIAPLALAHSKDFRKNLFFLSVGIFVNCLVTLLQATIFPEIVDLLSINPPELDVGFSGRYQGLTEFPVTLGLAGALAVLIGIGLFSDEKGRVLRWGLAILILVCSIGALLSGSRTFFGSLLPALLVLFSFRQGRRRNAIYALVAFGMLWVTVTYIAPGAVSRFSQRVDSVGLVDYGRLASAAQAVVEISEKPLLGWGVDHFDEGGVIIIPETGEISGAHNTLLRYWYAAGLLGAMGYLALFVLPSRRVLRLLRGNPPGVLMQTMPLALALCVFFFIVSNLGPYLYNRYLYVPMFVLAGFAAQVPLPVKSKSSLSAVRVASG